MYKKYLAPAVLSHQVVRFETAISSACQDTDKDGGYNPPGTYNDSDSDSD
ncbi:hypothetical protein JZ785_07575 [Alicyclobacillus curvatus]|jgi:hypothetical protein|nr:hypothetical protein JZ785_07575 [Alicyclobacillus curvatus]